MQAPSRWQHLPWLRHYSGTWLGYCACPPLPVQTA